jgi:hypothetical protein
MKGRIDLLARLKKAPASIQSVPLPDPGLGTGIPLPPFSRPVPPREAARKPQAPPQTIQLGGSEEIRKERTAASKRTALFATLAALVGLAAGFAVGVAQERATRGKLAVTSAGDLEKEVKAANQKLQELGDKLQDASDRLGRKEFPADLTTALGALTIPFEPRNLEKPGIGNMGKTLRSLIRYASAVQELNDDGDQLRTTLASLQPRVEKAWKEENEPQVGFSVIFRPEREKGMMAELVPNRNPFKLGADFPAEYTVLAPEVQQGRPRSVEKKVKRWIRGDLTGGDPIAVPVTPQTISFVADKVLPQLRLEIAELVGALRGKNKGTPWETNGLLEDGGVLAGELHELSLAR